MLNSFHLKCWTYRISSDTERQTQKLQPTCTASDWTQHHSQGLSTWLGARWLGTRSHAHKFWFEWSQKRLKITHTDEKVSATLHELKSPDGLPRCFELMLLAILRLSVTLQKACLGKGRYIKSSFRTEKYQLKTCLNQKLLIVFCYFCCVAFLSSHLVDFKQFQLYTIPSSFLFDLQICKSFQVQ